MAKHSHNATAIARRLASKSVSCGRPHEQPQKNGPPMSAVTMPTGTSMGDSTVRATRSHTIRKVALKEVQRQAARSGDQARPADEPDEERSRPTNATGPLMETAAPVASEAPHQRHPFCAHDIHTTSCRRVRATDWGDRAAAAVVAIMPNRDGYHRQHRQQRSIATDVQHAHQPANGAVGCR